MLLIDDYLLPAMMFHWLLSPRTPIQEMLVTLPPVGIIYSSDPILSCSGCASRVRDLARNFYVHSARGGCEGIKFLWLCSQSVATCSFYPHFHSILGYLWNIHKMVCFRLEWILIEQRESGQALIEIDIEVGLTWRGIRHLSVDVFMVEQSVLEQVLVEIDIEVGVGLTWRGMVEIVCISKW